MATIYKRLTEGGRIRYMAYIPLKGHPRQSQTFDRKADAIRWAKQHETAVQTGGHLVSQEASKRTLLLEGQVAHSGECPTTQVIDGAEESGTKEAARLDPR